MKKNIYKPKLDATDFLTSEEIEFLDRLISDAVYTTNLKFSRYDVISAIIRAAMALDISANGLKDKQDLIQRILDTIYSKVDRREYPRLKKHLSVEIRKANSVGTLKKVMVGDVSMGGFRLDVAFLDKPLAVEQIIEITIKDPNDESSESITALGKVAWVREKDGEHCHEMGVALTYMSQLDKARFIAYLREELDIKLS